MKTEENKRMLALSCIVADLKAENMELVERVQQLEDDYNAVVRQLDGKETHKDEDPENMLLVNMQKMGGQFDRLIRKSGELERFAKAIHLFVDDKNLYMKKGASCWYQQASPVVCSTACLECVSCLGVIEGHGVICEKILKEASVSLPDNVGEVRLVEASSYLATDVCEERLAEESAVFPNDE